MTLQEICTALTMQQLELPVDQLDPRADEPCAAQLRPRARRRKK